MYKDELLRITSSLADHFLLDEMRNVRIPCS